MGPTHMHTDRTLMYLDFTQDKANTQMALNAANACNVMGILNTMLATLDDFNRANLDHEYLDREGMEMLTSHIFTMLETVRPERGFYQDLMKMDSARGMDILYRQTMSDDERLKIVDQCPAIIVLAQVVMNIYVNRSYDMEGRGYTASYLEGVRLMSHHAGSAAWTRAMDDCEEIVNEKS